MPSKNYYLPLVILLRLLGGRSGDQIPVGARYSAPFQIYPGAHPLSYTKGTGTFQEVKQLGRGVDRSSPSSAEVKKG
jgi:hypothetical protein